MLKRKNNCFISASLIVNLFVMIAISRVEVKLLFRDRFRPFEVRLEECVNEFEQKIDQVDSIQQLTQILKHV